MATRAMNILFRLAFGGGSKFVINLQTTPPYWRKLKKNDVYGLGELIDNLERLLLDRCVSLITFRHVSFYFRPLTSGFLVVVVLSNIRDISE